MARKQKEVIDKKDENTSKGKETLAIVRMSSPSQHSKMKRFQEDLKKFDNIFENSQQSTDSKLSIRINNGNLELVKPLNNTDIIKLILKEFKPFNIEIPNKTHIIKFILENNYIFDSLINLLNKIKNLIPNTNFNLKLSEDPEIGNSYLSLTFTYDKSTVDSIILKEINNYFAEFPHDVRDCIVILRKSVNNVLKEVLHK